MLHTSHWASSLWKNDLFGWGYWVCRPIITLYIYALTVTNRPTAAALHMWDLCVRNRPTKSSASACPISLWIDNIILRARGYKTWASRSSKQQWHTPSGQVCTHALYAVPKVLIYLIYTGWAKKRLQVAIPKVRYLQRVIPMQFINNLRNWMCISQFLTPHPQQ